MTRFYIHMMNLLEEAQAERGAAGVEYGILVAAVSAVIVVAAMAIGNKIGAAFDTVNNALPALP